MRSPRCASGPTQTSAPSIGPKVTVGGEQTPPIGNGFSAPLARERRTLRRPPPAFAGAGEERDAAGSRAHHTRAAARLHDDTSVSRLGRYTAATLVSAVRPIDRRDRPHLRASAGLERR